MYVLELGEEINFSSLPMEARYEKRKGRRVSRGEERVSRGEERVSRGEGGERC